MPDSTPRDCKYAPATKMPARRAKRAMLLRLVTIITLTVPIDRAEGLRDVALGDVAFVEAVIVDAGEPGHAVGEHGGYGSAQILLDVDDARQRFLMLGDRAALAF